MLGQEYLDAIQQSEGYNAKPFWDYKQWTSGYGTRASGPDDVVDKAAHAQRFSDEISKSYDTVHSFAPDAPDGVKAALTSLTYNAGPGWTNSGLGQAVRSGDWDTARNHFLQYNKAGGEFNQGLADRRSREAVWFGANPNNPVLNKMAGTDDYIYGDAPQKRGALYAQPPAPAAPQAPQEQPSFLQNLLMNGTGAIAGVPNGEGLGAQLQNAGAGLLAINNPGALSLIAAGRAKAPQTPYEVHIGRDGTAYRINKQTGEVTKIGNDKQAAEDAQKKQTADVVTTDIDRVGNLVNGAGLPSTGAGGYLLQNLPNTNAHDVSELLRGIKSNVGFDRLQQMRSSSPTGGALGAVSDTENKLLQSALGSLEQSQSKEQFMQNLARVKQIYGQVIHGPGYKVEGTPSGGGVPGTTPINIPGVRSIKQIN